MGKQVPHQKTRWKVDGGEASSLGAELRGSLSLHGVSGGDGNDSVRGILISEFVRFA
jgi:hypothetical protein